MREGELLFTSRSMFSKSRLARDGDADPPSRGIHSGGSALAEPALARPTPLRPPKNPKAATSRRTPKTQSVSAAASNSGPSFLTLLTSVLTRSAVIASAG